MNIKYLFAAQFLLIGASLDVSAMMPSIETYRKEIHCNSWQQLKNLEVRDLDISYTGTESDFRGFPCMKSLKRLGIMGLNLPMTSFAGFPDHPSLSRIDCFFVHSLTTLDGLENAKNLKELCICVYCSEDQFKTSNLSDWKALALLPQLIYLSVSGPCKDYKGIMSAQKLKTLRFSEGQFKDFRLSIPGYEMFPELETFETSESQKLESLDGIELIAPNLKSLIIRESSLPTDKIVSFFENVKRNGQLKNLETVEIRILDRSPEEIARIERLSEILGLPEVDKTDVRIIFKKN